MLAVRDSVSDRMCERRAPQVEPLVREYCDFLEKLKIKDGLRIAMKCAADVQKDTRAPPVNPGSHQRIERPTSESSVPPANPGSHQRIQGPTSELN
eukprot:1191297-Prorocentrum_minimum.AAC.3